MAHDHHHDDNHNDHDLIDLLDLDAAVLRDYHRDLVGWVAREAADRPRIVDLGAGSGTGSLALAREIPGATVTAVDVSAAMVAHLRDRALAAGLADRIHPVEADLDRPWPDFGPTEVIWAASAMHHLADPAAALASAFDALRPGGLLVIAELDSFPRFLTGTADEDLEARVHAWSAKLRHEAGLHMDENWGARMRAAGFTSVTERHFDINLRPPLPGAAAHYAEISLRRACHQLADRLPTSDLAALDQLMANLPDRDDLSVRTERTVWLAHR